MLKGISNIFRRRSSSLNNLPPETRDALEMFEENLNLLDSIASESDRISVFSRLITSFDSTFEFVQTEHVEAGGSIRSSLEKYVATCANLGLLVIQDSELSAKMFSSLEKINSLFSDGLPSTGKFIQMFSQLLQTAKMNSSGLFSSAFGFLSILFKNREFFTEFEELDGFSLVFTLFFMSNDAESTKYLIPLLFDVVPPEFYKTLQSQTTLEACLDCLSSNNAPCIAEFVSNFVSSCFVGDPNIFARFKDDGGFLQLNSFLLANCDDRVTAECYDVMLKKSNLDDIVVQSLFELFVNMKCRVSLRGEILKVIEVSISGDKQKFDKFTGVIPLSEWMFPAPQIDTAGYETLARLLFRSGEHGFIQVEDCLDQMIRLIEPPFDDVKPIAVLLGLIESLLVLEKVTADQLIEHQFLSVFIVKVDSENLRKYLGTIEFRKVLCNIFPSKSCEDYRFAIVQKAISVYDQDLAEFVVSLIRVDLSIEVFNLLLGHLTDLVMSDLIIDSIRANRNSFDLFMECTGFDYAVEFLTTKPESNTIVLRLLDALSSHGPKDEVEQFVSSLNVDSPLFKCDRDVLKETARKIGALLPFCDKKEKVSMIIMRNRAKYGIPLCLKMGMKYEQIPCIHKLANVFCTSEVIQYLMTDVDHVHKSVNRDSFPQRDVYQFSSADEFASLVANSVEPIRSFTCLLFHTKGMRGNFWNCGSVATYLDDGMISITQDGVASKLPVVDGWNTVHVNIHNGQLSCHVNDAVVDVSFPEKNVKQVLFGNKVKRLEGDWLMSTNVAINNSDKCVLETSGSVYEIPCGGFATYFDGVWSVEHIFRMLDQAKDTKQFTSVYLTLIDLHIINGYDNAYFWNRLLTSVKKNAKEIESKAVLLLYQIPSVGYERRRLHSFVNFVLKDMELFFCFSPSYMSQLIDLITSNVEELIEEIDQDMPLFLLNTIRAGVDESVSHDIAKLAMNILALRLDPDQIKTFVKLSLTVCDWSLQFQGDIPISALLELSLTESTLQQELIEGAVNLVSQCKSRIFSLDILVRYALLFDDNRSLCFLKMIAVYSSRDKSFMASSPQLRYAFARNYGNEIYWKLAFNIWSGLLPDEDGPLTIERPAFTPTVLEMLVTLTRKQASLALYGKPLDKSDLLNRVLGKVCDVPLEQAMIFTHKDCIAYILLLLNLGVVPESLECNDPDMKRQPYQWNDIEWVSLSADDIAQIDDGSETFKSPQIAESKIDMVPYDTFPFDFLDNAWTEKLPMTDFIRFFTNVLMAASSTSFDSTFQEMISGHDLMYGCFRRSLTKDLVFSVLIQFTQSEEKAKSPLKVISKCARSSVFADHYLDMLSLVISYMKLKFDSAALFEFRTILLLAFHFLKKTDYPDLFGMFYSAKEVVFDPVVLDDKDFCHFWLLNTSKYPQKEKPFTESVSLFYQNAKAKYIDSYEIEATEQKWQEFLNNIETEFVTGYRAQYAKLLVEKTKKDLIGYSKSLLAARLVRIANLQYYTKVQLGEVHSWLRKYESFYFRYKQLERTIAFDKQAAQSYHLSPIALPYHVSRVVSPSPFPIKCPDLDMNTPTTNFKLPFSTLSSRIPQVNNFGEALTSPEWFYCHTEDGESPFNYSLVLRHPGLDLLSDFWKVFGHSDSVTTTFLYNYIHPVPCVLFFYQDKIILLVLAEYDSATNSLELFQEPSAPIAFMPFTESVTMNEWHNATLFCGHVVLTFETERLMLAVSHMYVHAKRALVFSYIFDPCFILVFKTQESYKATKKWVKLRPTLASKLSNYQYLFKYTKATAMDAWIRRELGTYDYLTCLNFLGGRRFCDLSQYPVFPWVLSPDLEPRDLSLPMGQLDEKRARHYDETYNDSDPKYFYGCHYSLPGGVFWFMMRLPPFTFYMWDLNEGWDNSQRLFISVSDAYRSASSANQTDLKEPIPEMFALPEMYMNTSNLCLKDVVLPKWTMDSPYFYVSMMRKFLEESENIHQWIDLIFGYKETGEPAVLAKNLFLPSSYHNCTAESLELDEITFEDQVIHFGQCPIQLFETPHPPRSTSDSATDIRMNESAIRVVECPLLNPCSIKPERIAKNCTVIHSNSCAIPPGYDMCVRGEKRNLVVYKLPTMDLLFENVVTSSSCITKIAISDDALFVAAALENGKIAVFQMVHENGIPARFVRVYQFSPFETSSVVSMAISSPDFLLAAAFGKRVVVFNIVTKLIHRTIELDEEPLEIGYDTFEGILTVTFKRELEQYSVNGFKLHEISLESDATCFCVVGYEPRFDGRLVVVGDTQGTLSFFIVIESFEMRKLFHRKVFEAPCVSLFYDQSNMVLYASDGSKGITIDFGELRNRSITPTCKFCTNAMTVQCQRCQAPLCDSCVSQNGLCPGCVSQLDFIAAFRF